MNDRCERMRERIEDAIGRALGADEQSALDLHCAECESCRKYRERLLNDHSLMDRFAALHSASERHAEERVIAALPAEPPKRAHRRGILRAFPTAPAIVRIAVAAAVVIAVIAGIDFLRGTHNGAPAFASVIEKMEKARNVIYQDRRWKDGKWTTNEWGWDSAGTLRIEYTDSTVISNRRGSTQTELHLYPATKRADLRRWAWKPEQQRKPRMTDPVERVTSWYRRSGFSFVRWDSYGGKKAAVYETLTGKSAGDSLRTAIWIDVHTELPLCIEMHRRGSASSNKPYLYGLDVSDFVPPGSSRSAAAGWIELGPEEPTVIWENFRWNVKPDTSYFGLTPPPGYAVTKIDTVIDTNSWEKWVQQRFAEETSFKVKWIAEALSVWTSLSGGEFPEDIQDLENSSEVRPLLIAKHDKGGIPGDEFRAAFDDALQLDRGFNAVRDYEKGSFHYLGRGAALGDSTRIVCWGEEIGDSRKFFKHPPYWIIYADLHFVGATKPPKIPQK